MFKRICESQLHQALSWSPAVAILGARQVGKTTLARQVAALQPDSLYLDLEQPQVRARLEVPELFFAANRHRLLVLDEIQNAPELFSVLRGEIDADRRPGRFLILGSASFKSLQQSQSLAGRLALIDMAPLLLPEVMTRFADMQALWLRGGFPGSYMAATDDAAWLWRDAFVRHFLSTDLPAAVGVALDPEQMRRFWRMVAHLHGQMFNASAVAASLGVSQPTVVRYLDHLTQTLMLRRLEPYHANVGKRLVKSPKVYVRDSGLLHYLLNIKTQGDLSGHPSTGASWEGFVIEQICNQLPAGAMASFYRTAAGAELDLLVELGSKKIAFEVKFSSSPKMTKGFWLACDDVGVDEAYVVAPVQTGWPMKSLGSYPVQVIGPDQLPW
ncbi:ATP-binding protein [Rhodoferax sp.]|uniref:ATP-binding protein n=1 Tax=Rhodoferax sp. TaxID=50421 RepID=UPI0019E60285|nr:ATP-binding protein [Rhodoferax sp.]MBE0474939.1 ATP-binding protein [Rhodoferax sp.]